jgi:hypothetical protein
MQPTAQAVGTEEEKESAPEGRKNRTRVRMCVLKRERCASRVAERMQPTAQAVGTEEKKEPAPEGRKKHTLWLCCRHDSCQGLRTSEPGFALFVNPPSKKSIPPCAFSYSSDINNSPRADVWQPVVFLNLSGHPGI